QPRFPGAGEPTSLLGGPDPTRRVHRRPRKQLRQPPPRCLLASLLASSATDAFSPFLARSSARKGQRRATTTLYTSSLVQACGSELARSASQGAARWCGLPPPARGGE